MTLCTPNLLTKPIPTCTQELTIGTIETINSNLNIYIHDLTTDRTTIIAATSDAGGEIVLDLSSYTGLSTHSYELWVTLQSGNAEDRLIVTVGTDTSDTISIRFRDIYEGNDVYWVETQELQVA